MKRQDRVFCKFCRSFNNVKKGVRILKNDKKQVYFCKSCNKVFTPDTTAGKKTSPIIILMAVTQYCQNLTLEQTQKLIRNKYKIYIAVSTIHEWVKEFNPRYLKIKNELAISYPGIIKSFRFYHSGLMYHFKYHVPKLKEFTKSYPHLISYLENIHKFIDNNKFKDSNRCSQVNLKQNMIIIPKQLKLNKIVKKALILAKTNKRRHQVIEDYMLSTDRDTIAVEVPIYYYDKKLGPISGHIDILQTKNNKIYILDYKPNAKKENQQKVITQLTLYAIALSFRTKTPLNNIRCAYFDEFNYFYFKPKYKI